MPPRKVKLHEVTSWYVETELAFLREGLQRTTGITLSSLVSLGNALIRTFFSFPRPYAVLSTLLVRTRQVQTCLWYMVHGTWLVKSATISPTPYAYYPPAAKGKDKTLSIIISDLFVEFSFVNTDG